MKTVAAFVKKEMVLTIAVILALLSMLRIRPSSQYWSYLDFRTLAILFCLMSIVAGFQELGFFDLLAEKLLAAAGSLRAAILVLVFLCFFLSMGITNDVALITFVPFTITVLQKLGGGISQKWLLKIVVMQTIAANLGSMFTPIGNPQNLYLFGLTDWSVFTFMKWMLPYTLVSLLLLTGWILLATRGKGEIAFKKQDAVRSRLAHTPHRLERSIAYSVLLLLSLLAVGRIVPYPIAFAGVLLYILCRNRRLLGKVDYSLLGTFAALFIFIGNLGQIPAFHDFLLNMVKGRELLTAIAASQVMSNVPAAILLSGFTENIPALIVGTNLGGLGTLIASMASLISFKYVAAQEGQDKGAYIRLFTAANLVFLAVLAAGAVFLQRV